MPVVLLPRPRRRRLRIDRPISAGYNVLRPSGADRDSGGGPMRSRFVQRRLLAAFVALIALAVTVSVGGAAAKGGGDGHGKDKVKSKTDDAVQAKLSPDLQQAVED